MPYNKYILNRDFFKVLVTLSNNFTWLFFTFGYKNKNNAKKNSMPTKTKKTPIRELGSGKSEEKAPTGNFRACVMLDSCVYQIGKDVPAREDAFILCSEYRGMDAPIQIFDDQGNEHIINGQLKMSKDNSFFHNASSYFDKLMTQTYVSKSEILSLKKKLKVLKESGLSRSYNNILNRVTGLSTKAKGKNPVELLKEVYDDFKQIS